MNFYFEFTTTNYKVRHAIAVELSKLFPGSRFAGTATSHGAVAEKYLNAQKDIKYEFLHNHHAVAKNSLKQNIDYGILREFENSLPEKSLWRIIAVDSGWGWQFVKGAYVRKTYIRTINSHENILRIVSGYIRFYSQAFSDFKTGVFIPAAGQNSVTCPILEQICINLNVIYLMPEVVRTHNYMALTNSRQCTFPQINQTCRDLIQGRLELDISPGEKCYAEIVADIENTKYFDVSRIDHLKSRFAWLKFLKRSLFTIAYEIFRWQKEAPLRKNKDSIVKQPDSMSALFDNIRYLILAHYRRLQLINPHFYSRFFPANLKYVYFPVHNSNEYSTQVQGTMWINQLQIIEALAKSVPHDWKVVVKEHPGTLLWRVRPKSFYDEIKSYPNVLLIPTETNSNYVISNAQLVVTIIGTTGWEAVIRGIPVIDFEENVFDVLGLSRRCTDFKELSAAIPAEIRRIAGIAQDERKRRIICLLTAIIKHGFWIDDPLKVTGDSDCTSKEEATNIGRIIANAMADYIAGTKKITDFDAAIQQGYT